MPLLNSNPWSTLYFSLRREHLMEDLMKKTHRLNFSALKTVQAYFAGEAGRGDGVTKELWCLFGEEVEVLCDGGAGCRIFRHDAVKLKV